MNYDVWGSWDPTVGPNSPLNDSCAPALYQQGSAVSAVKAWTMAGFPANKTILGVAGYGHSFHVNGRTAVNLAGEIKNHPTFDKSQQPAGDKWDSTAGGVDVCGNSTTVGGIYNFWALIEEGFLTPDGTNASGIYYRYDNCSRTVRAPPTFLMPHFSDHHFNSALRIQTC
jgi:chitinase